MPVSDKASRKFVASPGICAKASVTRPENSPLCNLRHASGTSVTGVGAGEYGDGQSNFPSADSTQRNPPAQAANARGCSGKFASNCLYSDTETSQPPSLI